MCETKDLGGMGFRDLRSFNRALLAKQMWRIVTRPESLVARVLKAKYYRQGDVWSAEIKSNSSFIWRSLMWSRDILAKGCMWRVGCGRDISVFKDKWVKDMTEAPLVAREPGSNIDMRVAELINDSGGWNTKMIEDLFLPHEIGRILNTPIGGRGRGDCFMWRFEDNGRFSVKSAYLAEKGYYDSGQYTSSLDRKAWSKAVWSLSIPPKIRVFLWRAFSNIIPTSANLREQHVPAEGVCQLCFDRWGTTVHCLLFCPKIKPIWKKSRYWPVIKKGDMVELWDIGAAVRKVFSEEEYEWWAIMLWKVWNFICTALHGRIEGVEEVSEDGCVALWEAYQEAKPTLSRDSHLGVKLGERKWSRPKKGIFRVDVDVLFNTDANAFGVGAIIRNSEGQIIVALSKRTAPSATVMAAEVMAIVHGVILSLEHHIGPIAIYTDSLLAARTMADPEEERDLLPDDVWEIINIARDNMLTGVFHMYRSANRAAHSLAQFALNCLQPSVWVDNFPSWLRDIVLEDLF